MASAAVESKTCECVCERNPGGDCSCVCTVPCAFNADSKTVEWTCECKSSAGEKACRCKFQVRCNRQEQGGCDGKETELFTAKCQCGNRECTMQIRKCKGCEITRVECACPEGGSCGSKAAEAKSCEGCDCGAGKN